MRNSENSSTRSKLAALTRVGLLVLIFAVVFATVLSCGAFGESATLNNGSVENVAEAGTVGDSSIATGSSLTGGLDPSPTASDSAQIAAFQDWLHSNPSGSFNLTLGFESTKFSDTNGVFVYSNGNNPSTWDCGAGAFGGGNNPSVGGDSAGYVAANIYIPRIILLLIDSEAYSVTASWSGNITNRENDSYEQAMGMTNQAGAISEATLKGNSWITGNAKWDGNPQNEYRESYALELNNSSNGVLSLCLYRGATAWSLHYNSQIKATDVKVTFTVKISTSTDTTGPYISSQLTTEGDTFAGLSIPQSDFDISNLRGKSELNSAPYQLGYVTNEIAGSVGGIDFYKKVTFTIKDGDRTNLAFYSGIKGVTLSREQGSELTVLAGTEAVAEEKDFYLSVGAATAAGSQSVVEIYFAASGSYKLTLIDNGKAFSAQERTNDIVINVEGIDTKAPDADGTAPTGGSTELNGGEWQASGTMIAALDGMDVAENLTNGDSAWVYFFDVKYSFFPFTSAPSADTSAITDGNAYPFAVNNTTNKVYFSYNTTSGAIQYRVGDTGSMTALSKAAPLSGEKIYGKYKYGYYAFIIYVADMAGNISSPFVYYIKVDSSTVSDGATSYTYGADKTEADGWINQYMLGENGKVYVDISFKLNPSGNLVTFNYGGNYYGPTYITDSFDLTATVEPTAAGGATVTVTGGEEGQKTLSTDEATELVSGTTTLVGISVPRAVLEAQFSLNGSGENWTVTLTLIYSRGSVPGEEGQQATVGELNINSANKIGVASVFGQTASFKETVNVKVDTQSINSFAFSDDGYIARGDYSEGNGGIVIGTATVAGRNWYTSESELNLYSNTNASTIYEYQLTQPSEFKNYATYFGWKIYTNGATVNKNAETEGSIAYDLAQFKTKVAAAGTGMAQEFKKFFGTSGDGDMWQYVEPPESDNGEPDGNLLPDSTGVSVYYGPAGVRVLYIMTLDQAGNANFAIYYLFVDTTDYEMSFDIPADYTGKFPALGNVTFEAFVGNEVTLTFKRGQNIAVDVNGLPTGYVPYTVSKVIGDTVVEFYNQNLTGDPTSGTYGMKGFIDGAITTPSDYAGGNSIAFVLDQASNLGIIGDGTNLGLQFTFRRLVNLGTVTAVTYNGYAVADEANYDKTLHVINAKSAAELSPDEVKDVRLAAYKQLEWSGSGLPDGGKPINAGEYSITEGVDLSGNLYYISDKIESFSLTVNKREIDLTGKVGIFANGKYGDIANTVFNYLKDDAVKGLSLVSVAGVADLGKDTEESIGSIVTGSGLVLVNGTAADSFSAFSAGNLNAGTYIITLSSNCTAANYTFKLSLSFTVDKRDLEVTVTGNKTYGSADGDVTLEVEDEDLLYGNLITDVFPDLRTSGSLTAILDAGSAGARNYTYENQGTDNYTNAGTYNITAVYVPSDNLSPNFTVVLKSDSKYTVNALDVYIVPDPGQVINTLTGYTITYKYRTAESGGAQIDDGRIVEQISAGSFVVVEEFVSTKDTYTVKVGTSFTLKNPEVVNLNLKPVTKGITITLDYDWDKTVITITFKVAPTATYMVNFDNGLLAYDTHKDNFAYSYSVTGGTPVEGLPEGVTISWTTGSLSNYNAATAQADTSYTVVLNDIQIMKDGAVDDSGLYSVVVGATVTVERLHVTLTPSFTETSKVYGDPDNWSGKYGVTASVADGVTLADTDFLSTLSFTGQLGRALYNASGFVRAGAANDPVNALLGDGEYYGAYTVSSYTCDNTNVIVDDISVDVLKKIEFTVTARSITADDVTAVGVNKPVPTGDANVPFTSNPFTIGNMVAGDDVYIDYDTAVYVGDDLIGADLSVGGIHGLDIEISGLVLKGDDAGNYTLEISGTYTITTDESSEEGEWFFIGKHVFEGITSGDVTVTKVYDATSTITEANFTISGVLADIQSRFSSSFYILGRRYGAYDYRMELQRVDAGKYTTASFAFFVEGLSSVSFDVPTEDSDFQVADSGDKPYNGMSGVYIVVFDTTVVIEQYQLQRDEINLTPTYTERYYNGTSIVEFKFAWADGADTSLFTSGALTNLRMSATFTVKEKNAGTYKGVTVSGFDFNTQTNFYPAFGNTELTEALASQVITVKPIPLNVTFAFVPKEYGDGDPELTGDYTFTIDPQYYFTGWEQELDAISITVVEKGDEDDITKFFYWDAVTNSAYPYVQYDASDKVRLHDICYKNVYFADGADGANLRNYTFAGNELSATTGSSGVIEAVAELTPKTLTFNFDRVGITKRYDGTADAKGLLQSLIGDDIKSVFGDDGLVNGDDKLLTIDFTAAYANANVGSGKDITVSGIALVANDDYDYVAKSYSLSNTSFIIQGCEITQAPLQVVFTLPTKTYDGTKFVDSVEGAVYYVLGGEYGDFKTPKDRSSYRVTYKAAGYNDENAGDVVSGIFIGVALASTNSSTVNYYLVDGNGNELSSQAYRAVGATSSEVANAVARYAVGNGYEYLVPGSGNSYAVITATGKIEKAVYAVTINDTVTKEFDNTDVYNGDLSAIKFTVKGLDDTTGITITSATFASVNAGTWEVTFTLEYTGAGNANYTVSETATAKGTITKRTLTVSLADAEFVYGFGGSAPAYADRLAYAVNIADNDYAVVVQNGVAYITEAGYKALAGADATLPSETVTVDEVVYYALGGAVGDVTLTSAAFRQTNGKWVGAGEYDVTSLAGTADNFALTLAAGQKVTIVPATLTVSAKGDYNYVVDTAIADLEAQVLKELVPDGIVNGDVFTSAVTGIKVSFGDLIATSAPASKFAIVIDLSNVTSKNYEVSAGATRYVTVVLPALSVTAKSGQSSVYDGADRLAGAGFLAGLVNVKTDGVEKSYTYALDGAADGFAIKNAGTYTFNVKVTCAYVGLDGYAADSDVYVTEATLPVTYDVNKAALTITRSGKVPNVYYTAKAQKLTDYEGFFAFEGAVASEIESMLDALTTSVVYTSGNVSAATFTDAGAYEVALNATGGVFDNYNVNSGVTLLNVRKAPVNVKGTVSEGDINSDANFGVTVTGVVPATGCLVDTTTVGKLRTTVSYSSGAATVAEIKDAGVYNYVISLSDSVNYEIVSGGAGTLSASGTLTVTVKVITENDTETEEKKAEVVFDTPQTKAWTLTSYELAEGNSTYNAYSSEVNKLAGTGQTAEIGGVIRLELVSGTTTINATTTGKLGEVVEISVKLPSALSSGTSGYTIYERQKDGSLKEVTDYVVNDGYLTYNSDLISDLVFVRIVGSGVPFWIWILVAVLAALIILAIILAAFIGRKDRSTTPPPAAPPAEPPVEDAPVSHDDALPAADVDIDIPDAPAHIGGGDRPPLIGTR